MAAEFREAVRSGRRLLGAFVKTASHQSLELMIAGRQDFAIVDAEHAPFDLGALDAMAAVGRAAGFPTLIRPPTLDAGFIGQALDMGFAGVVGPHAGSPAAAGRLLDAVKYGREQRGFSPSTRAGGFGAPDLATYRRQVDESTCAWCQVEDADALAELDALAAVEDVDCLFIGRVDLAFSMGLERPDDPKVMAAVCAVADAGRRHGRTVGIYVGSAAEVPHLAALGITVFVCGTDQAFVLAAARANRAAFDAA